MKNRVSLGLLLTLVVAVWGIIGYKVVAAFSNSNDDAENQAVLGTKQDKNLSHLEKPRFSIHLPERDPFLGKLKTKKIAVKPTKKKVSKPSNIRWPRIIYKGYVSGRKVTSKVVLININGEGYFAKEKQEVTEEIKLIKTTAESAILSYKGERKTFEIEKDAFGF